MINLPFFEENCTITFKGKDFIADGAFIIPDKNGRLQGFLYSGLNYVQNWYGDLKIPAIYGFTWKDNFGGYRQTVYFKYNDKCFSGICFNSMYCRVKEISEKSFNRALNELKRFNVLSTNDRRLIESWRV